MDMNLIYIKVLIITLLIKSIASQTQIYPLFSPTLDSASNIRELNKLVAIKPGLLRASSLTSLLKKPHLNLFNKPSSIAFLKVKNKKYLPQFLFSSSSSKSKQLPTYQLGSPITSSLIGTSFESIDASNLKSTGSQQVQQFINKPLFVPIQGADKNLKKLNSWSNLYSSYSNFDNQLPKTSLPVFVFSGSKSTQNNFNNQPNRINHGQKNENSNLSQSNPMKSNQHNRQHANQTMTKAANLKQTNYNRLNSPAYMNDFRPIVSTNGANNLRAGRTMAFDNKGQYLNEVKNEQQINYSKMRLSNHLPVNNMDLEHNILNTIEKDIELKNLKFIKSIILPKKEFKGADKFSKQSSTNQINPINLINENSINNQMNNRVNDQMNNQKNHQMHNRGIKQMDYQMNLQGNQMNSPLDNNPTKIQGNSQMNNQDKQMTHSQFNNQNSNYQPEPLLNHLNNHINDNHSNNNQNFKSPAQPIQQQSVQHFLKTSQNNQLDRMPDRPSDSKDKRSEKSNQSRVKMPKFKVIQYADKSTIEEFTKALENIDFKSITQSDIADLPEFVYNRLTEAKIETGHRDDSNRGSNNQLNNNNYNNNEINKPISQTPPLPYFTANDCAKNHKSHQMNGQQQAPQQYNQQQTPRQHPQQTTQHNQQQNQQYNQQVNNQQSNYQQQQQSGSQQKSAYFNDQQTNSINSLVKFDDQANFYSTSSTKLRQLKVLPTGELSQVNDVRFNRMNTQDQMNSRSNQANSRLDGHQSGEQPVMESSNLNSKEINEWNTKEINDDETVHNKSDLDNATGVEDADQFDGITNKKLMTTSTETDSLDPTKLDLRVIHLPASVLKQLVQVERLKKKKK